MQQWITDYLTNCVQYVVVGGVSSKPLSVVSGVPQGSVLGPLLFLIYINEMLVASLFGANQYIENYNCSDIHAP